MRLENGQPPRLLKADSWSITQIRVLSVRLFTFSISLKTILRRRKPKCNKCLGRGFALCLTKQSKTYIFTEMCSRIRCPGSRRALSS